MNTPARKIIAFAFIAVFFLTAPIVLLRAAGYRYNWKKGAIEKTGVLRLDSEPADAAVIINGRTEKKRTPALVTALLPDDYRVRIEKKGYLPWEKTLRVQSGRTTFATGVVLFNETLPGQVFAADAVAAAFSADGKRLAFAARRDGVIEIGTAEMPPDKVALAARYSRDDIAKPEISWSPDGERFLFRAVRKNGRTVASIYAAGGGEPVPLEKKMPAEVRTIRWSSRGDSLLLIAAGGIYRIDADSGELTALEIGLNYLDAVDIDGGVYALRRL
ncbi:PD40 domain-containing protein, partial [Candidatus Uhrbacteria bacterium]|nr:PD40 domain-containing protein [Candidatus Uhrbacteria bacterium]